MSYDSLRWYKDQICRMSWDEILEIMKKRIKDGSWDKYVDSLGTPPHVIKHNYLMKQMEKK
tara:strand:- start:21 stop:203 length:183 start_codon:yes stop_codon:yes gene_type:complete